MEKKAAKLLFFCQFCRTLKTCEKQWGRVQVRRSKNTQTCLFQMAYNISTSSYYKIQGFISEIGCKCNMNLVDKRNENKQMIIRGSCVKW
jgi:hypothetical protein